ncbi:MAG: peptide chain release factor N(5)-glutamine methyltransferase [Deltaproteobacteria bacterium]|nr:peptide chain release factor N(5)-glutamine methyltransferase [Deltaproteobacteria bacterium]
MTGERTWTAGEILTVTAEFFAKKGIGTPRLDAELLLAKVLHLPDRVKLYTGFERVLTQVEVDSYRELVRRRSRHEPAAYILGVKEFYAIPFEVTRDTLIPRPETELLVDEALALARAVPGRASVRVCDVGAGCGAIALAVAANLPEASVEASDVSAGALACARRNAAANGLDARVRFVEGDLMLAFSEPPFDLVLANLPYVPAGLIPGLSPDVRDYEPRLALDGGDDGLALYRRLLPQAAGRMKPGGALIAECQPDQFQALTAQAMELGLSPRPPVEDLSGRERIFSAMKP